MNDRTGQRGFTLIELLLALALGALIVTTISSILRQVDESEQGTGVRNRLALDGRFAMDRMTTAVAETRYLYLPQPDKPDTNWRENVREETVPASPPEGDSTKATAVLAVTLAADIDLDGDGFPDADNDRDGRIDEDFPDDITNDAAPGIYLIDDGGDGVADDGTNNNADDDERLSGIDEDPLNGIDDDGDGVTDEDPGSDMNADGAPGILSLDDDADGQVDEGSAADDDEDGAADEDWLDVVVFYLQDNTLVERHPVPWDETANGFVTGRDYIESVIAENVILFRVERMAAGSDMPLVDIKLELSSPDGSETVSLQTRVRTGGRQ